MFAAVIYASVIESQSPMRLGLLQTYKTLFQLDDSLADIKTTDDLFEYLSHVSSQAKLIQPLSSNYFVEESGELKVMQGMASFSGKQEVEVKGLTPRIDSPSWSFMAWVQLNEGTGANIIRKPLGKKPSENALSCWGWYVGKILSCSAYCLQPLAPAPCSTITHLFSCGPCTRYPPLRAG